MKLSLGGMLLSAFRLIERMREARTFFMTASGHQNPQSVAASPRGTWVALVTVACVPSAKVKMRNCGG